MTIKNERLKSQQYHTLSLNWQHNLKAFDHIYWVTVTRWSLHKLKRIKHSIKSTEYTPVRGPFLPKNNHHSLKVNSSFNYRNVAFKITVMKMFFRDNFIHRYIMQKWTFKWIKMIPSFSQKNKTVARPELKKINCHGEFQKIIIAILLFAWVTKVMKF